MLPESRAHVDVTEGKTDRDEALLGAIVEVPLDASALLVASGDDAGQSMPSSIHVVSAAISNAFRHLRASPSAIVARWRMALLSARLW